MFLHVCYHSNLPVSLRRIKYQLIMLFLGFILVEQLVTCIWSTLHIFSVLTS